MQPLTRPVLAAALMVLLLGSVIVAIGGIALDGQPDRLSSDLAATGVALAAVLGLSVWAGISANRRARRQQAEVARREIAADVQNPHMAVLPASQLVLPTARRRGRARTDTPLKARLHPATWARVLGSLAAAWLAPTLTVAVLFGVFFTSQDGPPARAFRHAPACVGETNLATCVGTFSAVVNGVRTPANGASFAGISYVTRDGAINTWAQFDGNATAMARVAVVDENEHKLLRIRVWRRSIIGADLGDSWYWIDGNPPGDTVPAVFLPVSFASLLLGVRLRIHRRAGMSANRKGVLVDDVGQAAAAAGSVVLLAYGFLLGAILALALWHGSRCQPARARDGAGRRN